MRFWVKKGTDYSRVPAAWQVEDFLLSAREHNVYITFVIRDVSMHELRTNFKAVAETIARGGEVTLRGSVASYYERQIAIQACRMLAGIVRVNDAVEVAVIG